MFLIKLYKRKFFIDEVIYTTNSGLINHSLEELLKQLPCSFDIMCDTPEILYDVIEFLPYKKIIELKTNADFSYMPFPHELIKEDSITIVVGNFDNGKTFKKLHQIGFIMENNQGRQLCLRMGIKL